MIKVTPAGAMTATAYPLTYEIVEKLCKHYCTNGEIQPIVKKDFSVTNTELVGDVMYGTVQCVVSVSYKARGGCPCSLTTNTFIESFNVSFGSATATSTISAVDSDGYNEPAYISCNNNSMAQGIKSVGTVNVTFSA